MAVNRVAFVCVGNAGRSQMATAFAERERDKRGLDIDIVTGGTDPADYSHESVVDAVRPQRDGVERRAIAFFDELKSRQTAENLAIEN